MKIEMLKLRKKKYFLYALIVGVLLLLPLVLSITFGKYQTRESIKLVEGSITYKPYELNVVAVNIENDNGEYTYSEDIPTSGYYLDDSKSYCEVKNIKDNSIKIEYTGSKLEVTNISKKGTRCYVYFNKTKSKTCQSGATACETIVSNTNTIGERTDFGKTVTVTTTRIMYQAEDDYGTSYYFAGAPTDNWVKFAGMYWRIIRINGDGTIRMIYQGDFANTTGEGTQIGTSAFNTDYNDNAYVGYMYTNGQVHGTSTASTIKGVLDSWYDSNLASYVSNIAIGNGATFCNDRQSSTDEYNINDSGGTGTTQTYYAVYNRLYTNKSPSLKCTHSDDRFDIRIGLIAADEVLYAGGLWAVNNTSYYLYTGHNYWTMSPSRFYSSAHYACVFFVVSTGWPGYDHVNYSFGVRPVINLKSDTQFSGGDGTASNPYVVS